MGSFNKYVFIVFPIWLPTSPKPIYDRTGISFFFSGVFFLHFLLSLLPPMCGRGRFRSSRIFKRKTSIREQSMFLPILIFLLMHMPTRSDHFICYFIQDPLPGMGEKESNEWMGKLSLPNMSLGLTFTNILWVHISLSNSTD